MSRAFRIFRSILKPKILGRLFFYPVLVVAAFFVGTLAFLCSDFGNEIIKTSAEELAPASFPELRLKIEKLETDILTGIELREVSLRLKGKEEPAITVESFELDWDLMRLIQENKLRSFLYISGIRVNVEEEKGELNLAKLFASGQPSEPDTETPWPELPLDIELSIIDINDTKLRWEEAEITTEIEASLYWNEGENVDLQLQQFQAHMPEIGDLASRIAISGNSQLMALDISLQQEKRGITVQGKIEDVIGKGVLDIEANIQCRQACLKDFTEQDIPQIDQEIAIQIGGTFSEITSRLMVGKNDEFPVEAWVRPNEEIWKLRWSWNDFKVNDWVGDLEPIILQGEYSLEGKGFSYEEDMQVDIQTKAGAQDIWNEKIDSLALKATLDKGQLAIEKFVAGHEMGEISLLGDLDLLESNGKLQLELDIDDFTYLKKFDSPDIKGKIRGAPIIQIDWKTDPKIKIEGVLEIQDLDTAFGQFQRLDTQLSGDIDSEKASLQLTHHLRAVDATGIKIPALDIGTDIVAEFSGKTRVDGLIYAGETKVEDGVVVLHDLKGGFTVELADDLSFATKDMQVGGVELVPIQYKIDGGPVSIQLKENNLVADLHLLRKEKTFIDVQAKSDLNNGTWWLNQLVISPTEGKEWGISEGIVFQLSDKGVQDFRLSLASSEGEISIFADTGNDSPDFSVEVKDLQLEYALELADLFGGIEGIPEGTAGLMQGAIHIQGEEGKFGDQDFFMVQNLYAPELAEHIDIILDIRGQLEKPRLKLVVSSATTKDEFVQFQGYWPLNFEDGFAVNCQEYGNMKLFFSETNWKKWQPYFPQTPDMDVYLGMQVTVKGNACKPYVQLSGVAKIPLGGEKNDIRADWQAIFDGGDLNFTATVEEKLQPIFIAKGAVETNLEVPIHKMLETMVWEEPEEMIKNGKLTIKPQDLHLDRVLPLADLEGVMSGEITGEMTLEGNLSSMGGKGELFLKNGEIGNETIEDFGLHLYLNQNQADIVLDSRIGKKGEMFILAKVPFEEGKELDVTGDIKNLPFGVVEAFAPDLQNVKGTFSTVNQLEVRGTLDQPLVDAKLEGKDISFSHQYLGTKYRNIALKAEIKRNQIHLKQLGGDIASLQSFNPLLEQEWGSFDLKGEVATGDALQSSWSLTLRDCTLIDNQMAHLVVSTGTMETTELDISEIKAIQNKSVHFQGNLFVHKGRIELGKDFFTDSASLDLNPRFKIHRAGAIKTETVDSMEWLWEMMEEMEGNVGLDLGDRIAIKAELPMAEGYGQSFASLSTVKVDTDLRGKINAGWSGGEPQMTGTISTIRGGFETMGRDFDIEEGEIVFTGGQIHNPQLNLTAQKGFGTYGDIVVRVGGTVEEMTIDFESQNAPETYDQTDILSLILLGKPAREMADSESQTSSLLLTAGLKAMGGVVGGALGGQVVDEIDWDPSEDMFQIGKSLNDSMFLSYTKVKEPDEGENQNQITLEWLILNRVYMEFITGDANNSEVTLYYRWIF